MSVNGEGRRWEAVGCAPPGSMEGADGRQLSQWLYTENKSWLLQKLQKIDFSQLQWSSQRIWWVETGPISFLSLLCAAGSDVEWASPRGSGAWVRALTCTSRRPVHMGLGGGTSSSACPQHPMASSCCWPLGSVAMDMKGACVHVAELGLRHLYRDAAGGLRYLGCGGTGPEWAPWGAQPLHVC